jgi:hypothetical protein
MNFRMTQKCTTLQIEKPFFPMSKNGQILQVGRLKHKEKLYLLYQLQNAKRSQVKNSGTNSKLNLP